jgi:hypothetical protein
MEKHGERSGWEKFGQWSLSKAKAGAIKVIREEVRKQVMLNPVPSRVLTPDNSLRKCMSSSSLSSCSTGTADDTKGKSRKRTLDDVITMNENICLNGTCPLPLKSSKRKKVAPPQRYTTVCRNGSCLWKKEDEYDDITDEIQGSNLDNETVISVPSLRAKQKTAPVVIPMPLCTGTKIVIPMPLCTGTKIKIIRTTEGQVD